MASKSQSLNNLGRTFNHLEDLVIFYGSEGAAEAIEHITDVIETPSTLRLKWDGGLVVYWGRNESGKFIFATHNGWERNIPCYSSDDVYNFILNQSGKITTLTEFKEREQFALKIKSMFGTFKNSTPTECNKYIYADILSSNIVETNNRNITFYPNKKSSTGYTVLLDSKLGKKFSQAKIVAVGHAEFNVFGADDKLQVPKKTFNEYNTSDLSIINPYYAKNKVNISQELITDIIDFVEDNKNSINTFLESTYGLKSLKEYIYRYINYLVKNDQISDIYYQFIHWASKSNLTDSQKTKLICYTCENSEAIRSLFTVILKIMDIKNRILIQLENGPDDIRVINGEGWVKYSNKKFGNIKLVPRHTWSPK